jgi:hypothetical protein
MVSYIFLSYILDKYFIHLKKPSCSDFVNLRNIFKGIRKLEEADECLL